VVAALMQDENLAKNFNNPVAVICGGNAAAEILFITYQNAIG